MMTKYENHNAKQLSCTATEKADIGGGEDGFLPPMLGWITDNWLIAVGVVVGVALIWVCAIVMNRSEK